MAHRAWAMEGSSEPGGGAYQPVGGLHRVPHASVPDRAMVIRPDGPRTCHLVSIAMLDIT
jgi:hypothetical protein